MHSHLKIFYMLSCAVLIFAVYTFVANRIYAQATDTLSGFAWSSNVGWISFNCSNQSSCGVVDYHVDVAADGTLSGYAWSDHIGWISFNGSDTVGCPTSPCQAVFNRLDRRLEGWARALSADGIGWDGWIRLYNPTPAYGVTINGCDYKNFAWGGEVAGWISFDSSNCDTNNDGFSEGGPGCPAIGIPIPSYGVLGNGSNACGLGADIKADGSDGPVSVAYGTNTLITWTSVNAGSCDVAPNGWSGISGSETDGPITADKTYTLTCFGTGGPITDVVTVTVFVPPLSATCAANTITTKAGDPVFWDADSTGGYGPGSYTYEWSGSSPLSGRVGDPVYVTYTTLSPNPKIGSVTVTSSALGQPDLVFGPQACLNDVTVLPGITKFIADPDTILPSQSSELSWDTLGLTSCSIDQGIGPVPVKCNPPSCPNSQDTVSPIVTTAYTLSCTDGGGNSDTGVATVIVTPLPDWLEIVPE